MVHWKIAGAVIKTKGTCAVRFVWWRSSGWMASCQKPLISSNIDKLQINVMNHVNHWSRVKENDLAQDVRWDGVIDTKKWSTFWPRLHGVINDRGRATYAGRSAAHLPQPLAPAPTCPRRWWNGSRPIRAWLEITDEKVSQLPGRIGVEKQRKGRPLPQNGAIKTSNDARRGRDWGTMEPWQQRQKLRLQAHEQRPQGRVGPRACR